MQETARYARNLETVRYARLFMAANGDIDGLQRMAEYALTFAYMSIHNRVEVQEKWFCEYLAGDWIVRGLPAHRMVAHVRDLAYAHLTDAALFAGDDCTALATLLTSFPWLAAAKATFTCALLGYPDAPCIDVHMARLIGVKNVPADIPRYRAIAMASAIDSTIAQWNAYAVAVKAFARSHHDCYFRAVLGKNAVHATLPYQGAFVF